MAEYIEITVAGIEALNRARASQGLPVLEYDPDNLPVIEIRDDDED